MQPAPALLPPANPAASSHNPSAVPGPQYEYTALAELVQNFEPGFCNLYAIITECSVPRPTQRGNLLSFPALVLHTWNCCIGAVIDVS